MDNNKLQNLTGKTFRPIITNLNYSDLQNLENNDIKISNAFIISVGENQFDSSIWISDENGYITQVAIPVNIMKENVADLIKPEFTFNINTQILNAFKNLKTFLSTSHSDSDNITVSDLREWIEYEENIPAHAPSMNFDDTEE